MSENLSQTEKQIVTIDTYNSARETRKKANELAEPLRISDGDEAPDNGNFVLRLLNDDQESAEDRLVRVVGADGLNDPYAIEGPQPLLVSVRQIFEDGSAGPVESPYRVAEDGIILNDNENTPNFEKGYFVGAGEIGVEDFYASAANELVPRKPLEAEAELTFEQDIDRRFI